MSLPAFAKEHRNRLAELEAKVAELEKKLTEALAKKKPGPKPKEPE